MPSRGTRGLWLRGAAAVGASLLALASTGAMVTAAVVGHGPVPTAVLISHGDGHGNGHGNGNGLGSGNGNGNGNGTGIGLGTGTGTGGGIGIGPNDGELTVDASAGLHPTEGTVKPPKAHGDPRPEAAPPKPAAHHGSAPQPPAAASRPQSPAAPTPRVVVDTSDPAPFAAQDVAASEATRVLPVEALGPLSGISFGSGLFIWPILVAIDVLALAVIARLALRRRRVLSED